MPAQTLQQAIAAAQLTLMQAEAEDKASSTVVTRARVAHARDVYENLKKKLQTMPR